MVKRNSIHRHNGIQASRMTRDLLNETSKFVLRILWPTDVLLGVGTRSKTHKLQSCNTYRATWAHAPSSKPAHLHRNQHVGFTALGLGCKQQRHRLFWHSVLRTRKAPILTTNDKADGLDHIVVLQFVDRHIPVYT